MLHFQIFPVTNTTNGLPERKDNEAKYELLFQADLVPMGYSTYYVSSSEGKVDMKLCLRRRIYL